MFEVLRWIKPLFQNIDPDQLSVEFEFMSIRVGNWGSFLYNLFFSLGVFIAFVMFLYNAAKMVFSGHNPEEIEKAIEGIKKSVLGFILILIAGGLVIMVNNQVLSAINPAQ